MPPGRSEWGGIPINGTGCPDDRELVIGTNCGCCAKMTQGPNVLCLFADSTLDNQHEKKASRNEFETCVALADVAVDLRELHGFEDWIVKPDPFTAFGFYH
jgi:hypothetical protein